MEKTATVTFRIDPDFKAQFENAAKNLKMSMSQLFHTSVIEYIDNRVHKATGAFMTRALKLLMSQRGDTLQEALSKIERINSHDLLGQEMYSDENFMTDELFANLLDGKLLAAAKSKAVMAGA